MLSLAMVLILILGINFVFRSATDAVGAGNALNSINSDAQATQPMLFDDLRNVSKNPPCFIISSQLVTQFLNSDDAKTGSDPTIIVTDNAGSTVNIGNTTIAPATSHLSPAILGPRNHRADMLKFLAHALYHRRSGPDGTYYASDSSNDAFIEYGHAALPSNDLTQFIGPSSLPNTTSLIDAYGNAGVPRIGAYASDWVLARRVTLLKDPTSITTAGDYYYPVATAAPSGINGTAYGANMSPFSYASPDNNPADTGTPPPNAFQSSRYDLAGVTPEQFDRIVANAILGWQNPQSPPNALPAPNPYSGVSLWWNPLVYTFAMTQGTASYQNCTPLQNTPLTSPASAPYFVSYYKLDPTLPSPQTFAAPLYNCSYPNVPGLWYNRPQCNPTIQTPVTAASLAEMAPYFLQHCSQFIVEYAGDYMQQNANGDMIGLGPDGQIDFYLDANGNKHIRWYGMPRSSTGSPHLDGPPGGSVSQGNVLIRGYDYNTDKTSTGSLLNYFTDVIPLRDYYTMWFNTLNSDKYIYSPPWEVDVNFDPTHDYGSYLSVPSPNSSGNNLAFNSRKMPPRYVAAWHDDMPAMIRILIKVDDPNNKVKDGPWYEYVFRLK
jgi:hypothetical protein